MDVSSAAKITLHVTAKPSTLQSLPKNELQDGTAVNSPSIPLEETELLSPAAIVSAEISSSVQTAKPVRTPRLILKAGKRPPDEVDIVNTSPTKRRKTRKSRRSTFQAYEESSSDENYNPEGIQTKSGRTIISPNSQRKISILAAAATSITTTTTTAVTTKSKQSTTWPVNPVDMSCVICQRSPDTAENQIVFCDGCDLPYHQNCHEPVIDNSFVSEADKQWFCRECPQPVVHVPEEAAPVVVGEGAEREEKSRDGMESRVGSLEEKIAYLKTLPLDKLVSIILSYDQDLQTLSMEDIIAHSKAAAKQQPEVGNIIPSVRTNDVVNSMNTNGTKAGLPEPDSEDALWQDDVDNPGVSHRVDGVPVHISKLET